MKKITTFFILVSFVLSCAMPPQGFAQAMTAVGLMPEPGVTVALSSGFTPASLQGMVIHPTEPFKFDFIIHRGDASMTDDQKQAEYTKLIKYFLASLAVPDTDQWVNLSPYEQDRIVPDNFGLTEMGRDLLAQDYLLKQISASLTDPDTDLGKKFWDGVYAQAYQKFGTTDIPLDTFNKVWITPDKAVVYEKGNTVVVLENHLKVMMESDYRSMQANVLATGIVEDNEAVKISKQVMREVIIPAIEKEVNEGKNFAPLRQVYSGMLLATWYKMALKETILGKLYADQGKVKGVDQDPKNNQTIYEQYVQAFKKGVFNMIREDLDTYSQEIIPRKYFSGGTKGYDRAQIVRTSDAAGLTRAQSGSGDRDLVNAFLKHYNSESSVSRREVTNRNTIFSMPQGSALADKLGKISPRLKREMGFYLLNYRPEQPQVQESMNVLLETAVMAQGMFGDFDSNMQSLLFAEDKRINMSGLTEEQQKEIERTELQFQQAKLLWLALSEEGKDLAKKITQVLNNEGYYDKIEASKKDLLTYSSEEFAQVMEAVQGQKRFQTDLVHVRDEVETILMYFADFDNTVKLTDQSFGELTVNDFMDGMFWKQYASAKEGVLEGMARQAIDTTSSWEKFIEGLAADISRKSGINVGHLKKLQTEDFQNLLRKLRDLHVELCSKIDSPDFMREMAWRDFKEDGDWTPSDFIRTIVSGNMKSIKGPPWQVLWARNLLKRIRTEIFDAISGETRVIAKKVVFDEKEERGFKKAADDLVYYLGEDFAKKMLVGNEKYIKYARESSKLIKGIVADILQDSKGKSASDLERSKILAEKVREIRLKLKDKEFSEFMNDFSIGVQFSIGILGELDRKVKTVEDFYDMAQNVGSDAAQDDNVGGIDMNSANLELQIKRDGSGVPLPLDQQDLDNIKIDGLVPVILQIVPAANVPLFSEAQGVLTPKSA